MTNLLPKPIQDQHRLDLLNYYTLMSGVVLASGAIILAGCLLLFDQLYRANLDQLKTQKQTQEAQVATYLDVEKKAKELSTQLASASKVQQETTHWAELFRALQSVTPTTLSIEAINFTPTGAKTGGGAATKTTITGKADSRRTLGEFQLALSKNQIFQNVEIQTSTLNGSVISYTIMLDVDYTKLKGPA